MIRSVKSLYKQVIQNSIKHFNMRHWSWEFTCYADDTFMDFSETKGIYTDSEDCIIVHKGRYIEGKKYDWQDMWRKRITKYTYQ